MSECQIPGNARFQDARKCQNARKHQFPGSARIGVFGYIGEMPKIAQNQHMPNWGKYPPKWENRGFSEIVDFGVFRGSGSETAFLPHRLDS